MHAQELPRSSFGMAGGMGIARLYDVSIKADVLAEGDRNIRVVIECQSKT